MLELKTNQKKPKILNPDWTFHGVTKLAAMMIALFLAAVASFLCWEALPAFTDSNLRLRLMGQAQSVGIWQFIGPLLFGTFLAAGVALLLAIPIALGLALYINFYAPVRIKSWLITLIELMVAIPSVVYGLWGGLIVLPLLQPVMQFISKYFGIIPLFSGPVSPIGRVIFAASVILAIMVIPIIAALCREVFSGVPPLQMEGALALGATRWEMIKMVVLPYGRAGATSAAMVGLGRVLGETMAVAMVLSPGATYTWSLFQAGAHSTIAANIALQFPESTAQTTAALIGSGLILFLITLAVNSAATLRFSRKSAAG